MVIVLIGVTGSGKTTAGKLLARRLGWKFYEGDEFHSPANIKKLTRGLPLNDQDRKPWLHAIRALIIRLIDRRENAVIASSALKESYRRILEVSGEVIFVYLKAELSVVRERLKRRRGHFMNPHLIDSQYETLEEPTHAFRIDASLSAAEIVRLIRKKLSV